jgi:hypothetical protein
MTYNPLYEPTDYFQPFPEPEAVFAADVSVHARYLLPIASLSLRHINPEWSGKVHFVQPIEPCNGVIGEDTIDHHTYLCRENWIGFQLDDEDRYTFAADWNYFLAADPETANAESLADHYRKARESYNRKREHFRKHKALHVSYAQPVNGQFADDDRLELICQLGGMPGWGNWPETGRFPLSEHPYIDEDGQEAISPLPQAEDGTDFAFVGRLHSFCYVDEYEYDCGLFLFYHPVRRIVLETFDWS